jgi:hypothetical protein
MRGKACWSRTATGGSQPGATVARPAGSICCAPREAGLQNTIPSFLPVASGPSRPGSAGARGPQPCLRGGRGRPGRPGFVPGSVATRNAPMQPDSGPDACRGRGPRCGGVCVHTGWKPPTTAPTGPCEGGGGGASAREAPTVSQAPTGWSAGGRCATPAVSVIKRPCGSGSMPSAACAADVSLISPGATAHCTTLYPL